MHNTTPMSVFAEHALTPAGWRDNVLIRWDGTGVITSVEAGADKADADHREALVIPGMVNSHSHAFQRGFAGLSEYRHDEQDSFWSWRKLMYDFAGRLSLEQFETIAAFLYEEMVAAGYTSVCEFHYLHHQPGGAPWPDDAAAMSRALIRAADKAGIGLTLLPVFYRYAGFGRQAAEPHQQRFVHTPEAMLDLWQELHGALSGTPHRLGLAPHSLRAVDIAELNTLLEQIKRTDSTLPVHIHVCEQRQEVEDSLSAHGQTPVSLLMAQGLVDEHWCLVHATHMTDEEYRLAADKGAVVCLCPTTEANLGDGFFNLPIWQELGGRWSIGSDSNVAVNPAEELMVLEYGQRLRREKRNIYADTGRTEVARALYLDGVAGGAQAAGRPVAGIAPGQSADLVALDSDTPALAGLTPDKALAGHVFAASRSDTVGRVWIRGTQQERNMKDAEAFCRLRTELVDG